MIRTSTMSGRIWVAATPFILRSGDGIRLAKWSAKLSCLSFQRETLFFPQTVAAQTLTPPSIVALHWSGDICPTPGPLKGKTATSILPKSYCQQPSSSEVRIMPLNLPHQMWRGYTKGLQVYILYSMLVMPGNVPPVWLNYKRALVWSVRTLKLLRPCL